MVVRGIFYVSYMRNSGPNLQNVPRTPKNSKLTVVAKDPLVKQHNYEENLLFSSPSF